MPDRFGTIPIEPAPVTKRVEKKGTKPPKSPLPKDTKSKSSHRTALIWSLILLLTISCYCGLGFFGIPYYFSDIAPDQFQARTGLTLEAGRVTFNPFTFRLNTLSSRIIANTGKKVGTAKSITIDLAPLSLLRQDFVCNTIEIDELTLNITRGPDNTYNIARLFGNEQAKISSDIIQFSELPFFFSLNNITIRNSSIFFTDLPTGQRHTIEKIKLDLPTFSNIPYQASQYIHPQFSAIIDGSLVELSGDTYTGDSNGEKHTTKLAFEMHSLVLPTYAEYLPFDLPFTLIKGKANGRVELFFDPHKTKDDKFSIGFELLVIDGEIENSDKSITIMSPSTGVSGTFQPASKKILLSNLTVKQPRVRSTGKSLLLNSRHFFNNAKTLPAGPSTTKPFSLQIDLAIFDDGSAEFYDSIKAKSPSDTWDSLQLSIKQFNSNAKKTETNEANTFHLSGKQVGTDTAFTWQGKIHNSGSLKGELIVTQISSAAVFSLLEQQQMPKSSGIGNFSGILHLRASKTPETVITKKISDANVTIDNLKLHENNAIIFSCKEFKSKGLSTDGEQIDLGNVYLQNGVANFRYNDAPGYFHLFDQGNVQLSGVVFEGDINLFKDGAKDPAMTFTNTTIKANNLLNNSKAKNNVTISTKTKTGGTFLGKGSLNIKPFSMLLETGFNNLPIQGVSPLFTKSTFAKSIKGNIAGKGSFTLPAIKFEGELQVQNGSAVHNDHTTLSWKSANVKDVYYKSQPFNLAASEVDFSQFSFPWNLTSSDTDPITQFSRFLKHNFTPSQREKKNAEINIDKIRFKNSSILLTDTRLQPPYKSTITNLQGEVHNIHSAQLSVKTVFALTGKMNAGSFNSSGNARIFTSTPDGNIHLTVNNGSLQPFEEQLQSLTEIDINEAVYNLQLNTKWQQEKLQNTGSLVVKGQKPVSTESDMALALALMGNNDGAITLQFNNTRNTTTGANPLFAELLATFQTNIIKSSVSPLLLLSEDFTDLIDNDSIEFVPGAATVSDDAKAILSRYAEFLTSHPQVGLKLLGRYASQIDLAALQTKLTKQKQRELDEENAKNKLEWEHKKEQYEQELQDRLQQQTSNSIVEENIPAEVLSGFTPKQPKPVTVTQGKLVELATNRAEALRQHFISELGFGPERIIIDQDQPTEHNRLGESTEHVVKIKLMVVNKIASKNEEIE